MTLDEIIAALEAAEGPSRRLDARVAECAFPEWRVSRDKFWSEGNHDEWCIRRDGRRDVACDEALPFFTGSLDAALTLVPEGCACMLGRGRLDPDEPLYGAMIYDDMVGSGEIGKGETEAGLALALCIAALKARQVTP